MEIAEVSKEGFLDTVIKDFYKTFNKTYDFLYLIMRYILISVVEFGSSAPWVLAHKTVLDGIIYR